jgi:hypothetical protein
MARKKVEEPLEVKAYSLPKDLIDFLDSYAWSRRVSASAAVAQAITLLRELCDDAG